VIQLPNLLLTYVCFAHDSVMAKFRALFRTG